jgi:hypothetical protein
MRYCFAGVGFAITWFENFNHEKILLYCRTAGTSPSQELTCVAKAAHNARVNKLPYQDLCEALDPVSSVYCKEFAQLFSEQALKLDPPTLNTSE